MHGKTLEIRSTKLPGCGGKIQRFLVAVDGERRRVFSICQVA